MTAFMGLLHREAVKVANSFLRVWIGSRCEVTESFSACKHLSDSSKLAFELNADTIGRSRKMAEG